jgi:hypothetical protein
MTLLRRAGHRGAFLGFLTLLDCLYGYSLVSTPPVQFTGYYLLLPIHTLGWIWLGAGIFLSTGIFLRTDRLHFATASVVFVAWAGLFVNLWWQGLSRAWVSVVLWAAFAGIILIVSSWPEPPTFINPPDPDELLNDRQIN